MQGLALVMVLATLSEFYFLIHWLLKKFSFFPFFFFARLSVSHLHPLSLLILVLGFCSHDIL